MITNYRRNRGVYLIAALLVIMLGITSRSTTLFPVFLGKYPGDALWALLIFLLFALLLPKQKTEHCALFALLFSFAIECSQLYQAPWLNTIRHTTLGHLVLGSGFHTMDFLAYSVGVLLGALFDFLYARKKYD